MRMYRFGHGTSVGRVREHNEDACYVSPEEGLWIVADGMGGNEAGEVASAIAVKTISDQVRGGASLVDAVTRAHHDILAATKAGRGAPGMGCTVVVMRIQGHRYDLAWVGDSRAYLHDGTLRQLTHDHSYVQGLVDHGVITEEEARIHPERNVITQALGVEGKKELRVDTASGRLHLGDRLLLCSDGLTSEVDDARIADLLTRKKDEQAITDALIETANAHGGSDNTTVVVITAPNDAPARRGRLAMPRLSFPSLPRLRTLPAPLLGLLLFLAVFLGTWGVAWYWYEGRHKGQPVAAPVDQPDGFSQEQARQAEIQELLSAAKLSMRNYYLTFPAGNNALEQYQRVLELEPGNDQARAGIKQIVESYVDFAEREMGTGDFDRAEDFLVFADTVLSGEDAVSAMREKLARAKLRHEQEQAWLELERLRQHEEQRHAESERQRTAEGARLAEERRKEELASQQRPPSEPKIGDSWTEPYTSMEFKWVPSGCYQMGCDREWAGWGSCFDSNNHVHEVCLDGFWMGRYEVTQGQWQRLMNTNPSGFPNGNDYPVERVSWNDTQGFIQELTSRSPGYRFRLPTEAEWEYACRCGGKPQRYCGGQELNAVGWHARNSNERSQPVGLKAPNALGLYDMTGNVWEWTQDVWSIDAYSSHERMNPVSTTGTGGRTVRGGSWKSPINRTLSVIREPQRLRSSTTGFRLVREK